MTKLWNFLAAAYIIYIQKHINLKNNPQPTWENINRLREYQLSELFALRSATLPEKNELNECFAII